MIKAIYIAREDGDYDFVGAFAEEHDSKVHALDAYAKKMMAEGEEVIVKDFDDLTHLVDVLEVFPKTTMPLPHRQQSGRIK